MDPNAEFWCWSILKFGHWCPIMILDPSGLLLMMDPSVWFLFWTFVSDFDYYLIIDLMSVIHCIWNLSLVEQSSHKYEWCSRFSVLHYTCEYKSSRALPSYVIIQPLVTFKAINVCYISSHMQFQTSYFCLSFWQTHLRYSLVFGKLTWFVGKLLLIVRKIFFCFLFL